MNRFNTKSFMACVQTEMNQIKDEPSEEIIEAMNADLLAKAAPAYTFQEKALMQAHFEAECRAHEERCRLDRIDRFLGSY
jgi:hypothetical protein